MFSNTFPPRHASPSAVLFFTTTSRIFGGGAVGSCALSFCARVFATRHGRTNVVVMGVVVRHQRVATHGARVYLRACTRACEPTRDTRHASLIMEFD